MTTSVRVAYVCADPGCPTFGHKGSSVHIQEILRAMLHSGARVDVFAARLGDAVPNDLRAIRAREVELTPGGDGTGREFYCLAANAYLAKSLAQSGPFDLVYERHSLWSFSAMEYAREAGIPGVLEINAPLIEEQMTYRTLHDPAAAERALRRALGAASVLVAVSSELAAHLAGFDEARGRIHVVPNGINPRRFPEPLARTQTADDEPFTIGFVGSLKPWHGAALLADALAILRRWGDTRLLVVGDGPERHALRERLAANGVLDASEFTGLVHPERIPHLLARMSVACAPYPAQDLFYFSPLKIFEYMAAGRAIVASRIGQIADVIDHGVTGLLTRPGDASDLADASQELRRDHALRRRLGAAARRTALSRHTWDDALRRVWSLAGITRVPTTRHEGAPV